MNKDNETVDTPTVAVVFVTYGDRLSLIQATTQKVLSFKSVAAVIIVDNGSSTALDLDHFAGDERVKITRSARNLGSAAGFRLGIEQAGNENGIDYVAILDDDNLVSDNYFDALIELHRELGGSDKVAFCAVRSDREQYMRLLSDARKVHHVPGSFMGFDVPSLVKRGLAKLARRRDPAAQVRLRIIDRAPYGGLFLPAACISDAGLPRTDFVLYGDDHEYTRRLSQNGVQIYLTDIVSISDIDQSWVTVKNSGSRWIDTSAPRWRIYYAARNQHYIELTEPKAKFALKLNKSVLLARLYAEALIKHRSLAAANVALAPFRAAIRDASIGRLGTSPEYPLPMLQDADDERGSQA
ncbi:glycosyltransferase [Sphingomonas sp. 8AM]|uniref:glycosyltransferase n=1 Tax=Sphingomonas sp. 8AM TaxID=2653170 RepID=UPI0012F256EE|nr:glycosyltransferase [Sphingomonas sp. 8AM]VXC68999.1 conserved hypothetical protein [Sphingomonas sp. 8AM]